MSNFEKIFLFFAEPDTSLIFYKDFIKEIFNFTSIKDLKRFKKNKKNFENMNFAEMLTKKINDKKGFLTLLDLVKNIKIIDYEDTRHIGYNDFILALEKVNIFLDDDEKEKIFIEYEYYINGMVKYDILINIILDQYWNNKKDNLSENLYCMITNNGKKFISINYIQKLFKDLIGDNNLKLKLMNFIEEYKLINKNTSIEPLTLKELKKFLKYYNFGHYNDKNLKELISILKHGLNNDGNYDNFNQLKNYFNDSDNKNKKHKYSRSIDKNSLKKRKLIEIIKRLRKIFIEYGRKTFFNFIKQFKYYENNDKQIDRHNFQNVFNSYNIDLSREEIDIIFNKFGIDRLKNIIYFEDFLKYISVNCSNQRRENIINYVFDTIIERSEKFNRDLDVSFLKEVYNPKNNYFVKDESENNLEFIDCLELFHYCYKSFKSKDFYKKEFIEFYRFISFLIYSDNDFISLMSNEWRISSNYIDKFLSNINNLPSNKNYDNNIYERNNLKNYFLLDLKEKLLNKGVKGLINLHWKFLSYCSNVTKITLNDFINVLQMEHINFDKDEFNEIFNYFSLEPKNIYLDYDRFIRFFKKELNDKKLNIVEKVFLSLKYDNEDNENIPLHEIKKKYQSRRHPEVIMGKKTEDEKIKEFGESFDLNYDIYSLDINNSKIGKYVDFDMFANFYEYVSFIYPDDEDFTNLLVATWC